MTTDTRLLLEALNVVRMSAGWRAMSDETKALVDAAIQSAAHADRQGEDEAASAELELLAEIHELADTLLYSKKMKLPDRIHVEGMQSGLYKIWDKTKAAWESVTDQTAKRP